jgi:hypothetical protein
MLADFSWSRLHVYLRTSWERFKLFDQNYVKIILIFCINPLKTKRRLLYLKIQSVPRSKHFISVIKTNQFMLQVAQDKYKTHKYSVGRI